MKASTTNQTNILEKAGISPNTLPSGLFFNQKFEQRTSFILSLPFLVWIILQELLGHDKGSTAAQPQWLTELGFVGFASLAITLVYSLWSAYAVPALYRYRVRAFARKNNIELVTSEQLTPLLPESLRHNDAHSIKAIGCKFSLNGVVVTVFDYSCVVGSGRDSRTYANGLSVLDVRHDYPHLYLDSKKNGKNHTYGAKQKVQLEGGFSKYFDLYMPAGSQAGALTVFAPDVMQSMLDTGTLFDLEVDGKQAAIISSQFVFTNKILPNMLSCATVLGKEFKDLGRSWQPVFAADGKKFTLKGQSWVRILAIALLPFFIAIAINIIRSIFHIH